LHSDILLLVFYIAIALGFSFLCSIWEAVLLSTSHSHVALLVRRKKHSGQLMRMHKNNIEDGIAAILTLNTIAHTVGAAGAGAQAAMIWGSNWIGLISAVLTLMILVFSEIIPKTLGATYWKQLTPFTAYGIAVLVWILYPVVWVTRGLSRLLTAGAKDPTVSRAELEILARIGAGEGELLPEEHTIFTNLLRLQHVKVNEIMTPRTVVFMLKGDMLIKDVLSTYENLAYSRMPVYGESVDEVSGYVLRHQIFEAKAENRENTAVSRLVRPIHAVPETASVAAVLTRFTKRQEHIFLVVDEYGGMEGIVTLEDALESLLGTEITDETDIVEDLRELAEKRRRKRFRNIFKP
jgi:CBS domain containing-hemolysin-like protein